jgi:hypothetical protein
MPRMFIPRVAIDLGQDGVKPVEVRSLHALQLEDVCRRIRTVQPDSTVSTYFQLMMAVLSEDPHAVRALLSVVEGQPFAECNPDMLSLYTYAMDEDGREVDVKTGPQPCQMHYDTHHRERVEGCEDCAKAFGPNLDENGNLAWFYTDTGEPVPTPGRRSSSERSTSPIISPSSTTSDPGTPTT